MGLVYPAGTTAIAYYSGGSSTPGSGSTPALGGGPENYVYDGLSRRQSVADVAAGTTATYLYKGLDPVSISTVTNSSGATLDFTKVFVGLGLDERFQEIGFHHPTKVT